MGLVGRGVLFGAFGSAGASDRLWFDRLHAPGRKEGYIMWFQVDNSEGDTLYEGTSWPMARAALDYAVMQDNGCPMLSITPMVEE